MTPPVPIPRDSADVVGRPAPGAPRGRGPFLTPREAQGPAAAQAAALIGRVLGERYRVRAVLGEGGMGVVYEAEHVTIGKRVALKVLHPWQVHSREAVLRLRHEARVAGTIGHPNICGVYDMGQLADGNPYLVMERLHGETLAAFLARERRMDAVGVVDMLLQVLSALAAAHQRGVVHRDLKPDNIFLSQREGIRPVPKLLDFGVSKFEDIEEPGDPMTARVAAGTPYYMAPEQARGDRNVDGRVDLWAAGVVLYETLTGQRPFVAKNYNALMLQILNAPHRSVRELDSALPLGLARVVDRALAKRVEDRYRTAIEMQQALRAYKDPEGDASRRPLPIVINEPMNEDADGTAVFSRIELDEAREPSEGAWPNEETPTVKNEAAPFQAIRESYALAQDAAREGNRDPKEVEEVEVEEVEPDEVAPEEGDEDRTVLQGTAFLEEIRRFHLLGRGSRRGEG